MVSVRIVKYKNVARSENLCEFFAMTDFLRVFFNLTVVSHEIRSLMPREQGEGVPRSKTLFRFVRPRTPTTPENVAFLCNGVLYVSRVVRPVVRRYDLRDAVDVLEMLEVLVGEVESVTGLQSNKLYDRFDLLLKQIERTEPSDRSVPRYLGGGRW